MENKTFLQIHEKYFDDLKKSIQQDTKEVTKLLLKGKQKEADARFSRSFRELWACFEKDDKNGHFKDILNEAELPYRKIFNELNDEKDHGIARPKISGWLTELYVYYFMNNLLQHKGLDKRFKVLHSKKAGNYTPDVLIITDSKDESKSLLKKLRVAIEVKTIILGKDSKKANIKGGNTVKNVLEKKRWYEEEEKGYYLFMGEISSKYQDKVIENIGHSIKPNKESIVKYLESQKQSEDWVYLPYLNRLGDIVNRILSCL